ncbi:MAG: hypothetical protein AMJ46_12650 [Latescibacteria bacterium DG_63]|nr:MAG: hypothetical protein AMJ46_12650 [Latescibacteria bacterium DG_63]
MSNKNLGTLNVKLRADIRALQDPLKKAATSLRKFVDKAKDMRLEFAAAFAGMTYTMAKSVKIASSAEEQLNKMGLAFGKMRPEIETWAKTTATSIGRSQFEVKEFASGLQLMLLPMVESTEKAADMSTALTKLAYDLGSVYELGDDVALESLRAGLVGSMEPMLKFGVVMTQANLQQFAWARGIEKSVQKMSEQEKVMLRYAFMLEGTKTAQGDAANTAKSFANTMKAVRGALVDLGASMGAVLLPAATSLVNGIKELLRWFNDLPDVLKEIFVYTGLAAGGFAGLVGALGWTASSIVPMIELFGSLSGVMKNGIAAAGGFGAALKVVGKIAGAVAIAVGLVVSAVKMASRLGEALGDPSGYRERLGFKPEEDVGVVEAFEAIFVDLFQREEEKPKGDKQADASNAVADALAKLKKSIAEAGAEVDKANKKGTFKGMDFSDMSSALAEEVGQIAKEGAFGFDFAEGIPEQISSDIETSLGEGVEALTPPPGFKDSMATAYTDIKDSLGTFSELARAAEEGGKSGGVWGAIVAVVARLLQMTEFFQRVVGHFNVIVNTMVMALDKLLAPLAPMLELMSNALIVLANFTMAISELSFGIEFVTKAVEWVADGLTTALDWIIEKWNNMISGLANLLGKIPLVGDKLKDMAERLTLDYTKQARATYESMFGDGVGADFSGFADGLDKATSAVSEFGESLTNVPQGYKVALAQFNAMDAVAPMPALQTTPTAAGTGGSRTVNNEVHIHGITDPEELYKEIKKVQEMDDFINTGTTTRVAGSGVTTQLR